VRERLWQSVTDWISVGYPRCRRQFTRGNAIGIQAPVIGNQLPPLASPGAAPQACPSEVLSVVSATLYRSSTVVQTPDAPTDAAPGKLSLGDRVVGSALDTEGAAVHATTLRRGQHIPHVFCGELPFGRRRHQTLCVRLPRSSGTEFARVRRFHAGEVFTPAEMQRANGPQGMRRAGNRCGATLLSVYLT